MCDVWCVVCGVWWCVVCRVSCVVLASCSHPSASPLSHMYLSIYLSTSDPKQFMALVQDCRLTDSKNHSTQSVSTFTEAQLTYIFRSVANNDSERRLNSNALNIVSKESDIPLELLHTIDTATVKNKLDLGEIDISRFLHGVYCVFM